jgi:putative nucleotidyltransferase with HDIG domain
MIGTESILKKIKSLPSMPDLIARLHQTINDPKCSVADLERIIRTDSSLTTNLLRMANSAFFGLPRKVNDIQFAVTLLGSTRVFEAATGSSFLRLIPDRLPGYEIDARSYWIHSVAVAILTEQLTKEIGMRPLRLAFTAGLLHDIGKLVIGTFLAEEANRVREQLDKRALSFIGVEQAVLGTDHAQVGATLAERWDLPPIFAWAARWHHKPSQATLEVDRVLVDLIHTADALAHLMGYGADIGELQREIEPDVPKRLNLSERHMERAIAAAKPAIEQMGEMIETPARKTP